MKFTSTQMEKAWQEELARSKRTHDVMSMAISIALTLCVPSKRWLQLVTPFSIAHGTFTVASGLAISALALRSSRWYHERRCALLWARQMIIVVSYYLCIARFPVFDEVYPINPGVRARMLLLVPAMILNVMLSSVYPMQLKASVGAALAATGVAVSWRRCAAEMALFPAEMTWYRAVLTSVDDFLRRTAPLQADIINGMWPITDAAVLSDRGACVAAYTCSQMAAMALAVAVMRADEELSRSLFTRHHALMTPVSAYAYRPQLALSLIMAVAEAYFGFYLVLRTVQLVEVAGSSAAGGAALELLGRWMRL